MELQIAAKNVGEAVLLEVMGELEIYTAPRLQEQLEAELSQGTMAYVIDLTQVEFIDSTGLAVLNAVRVRLRDRGGVLLLVCDQERVLRPFKITGLDRLFSIYPTSQEALTELQERRARNDGSPS